MAVLTGIWIGLTILIFGTSLGRVIQNLLLSIVNVDLYLSLLPALRAGFGLVYVVCLIVLVYRPVIKSVDYLDRLVHSVDALFQDDNSYIQLPEDLQGVENRLNALKQASLRNAQVAAQAEQRKNDLVVYLAHDIRTPLTSIIGYLNLLNEAPDMPPEQKAKYVGITLEKAYRLEDLVNEFFDITRFNLQTIVLHKEDINLTFMLEQIADEHYPILAPQGKRVVIEADAGLIVHGDADKLSRVFNNVLKNAAVYSAEGSDVYITAYREEGSGVVVKFSNRGNPIPPEKLDMIFEKFYRLDASRSTQTGGAGLGLAIAKEVVTAHGGTIEAHSEEYETVFTITLP